MGQNHFTDKALERIVASRVANTDETPAQARKAILKIIADVDSGKIVLEVFDKNGVTIGVRDKDGYHPNSNDPERRGRS